MAGVRASITTGTVATGTGVLKTLAQIMAAANHRALIKELTITFQGVSTTGTPIPVRLLRQTTAGTMTAVTPAKLNSGDPEAIQTTAAKNATVEPTAGTVLRQFLVHPQTGLVWQGPFGEPIPIAGGERLGVEVNNPGTDINCQVEAIIEE